MCCINVRQFQLWVFGDTFRPPFHSVRRNLTSSPDRDPHPPAKSDYKQVNSSLYQLYPNCNHEGDLPSQEKPEVDIIFFHGLQAWDYVDAFWKTWKSETRKDDTADRDGKVVICWPKEWLGPDLQNSRIFSATYDSTILRKWGKGVQDLPAIGENLVRDIIMTTDIGQKCPVILVGHSLGGITIKMFVLSALEKEKVERERDSSMSSRASNGDLEEPGEKPSIAIATFLSNLKGVFFYSTPQAGAELADLVPSGSCFSPVLKFLRVLNEKTADLNHQFQTWRRNAAVKTFTVGEALPTYKRGECLLRVNIGIVVPEGSARFDTDGYYTAQADHFKVCKPSSRLDATYQKLLDFIESSLDMS